MAADRALLVGVRALRYEKAMTKLPVVANAAQSFPMPQRAWVEALVGEAIPSEPLATCSNCVMLSPAGERPGKGLFDATTKCCTYFPRLPNFLVGNILAEGDPEFSPGRERVIAQIAAGAHVSPLGISPPESFRRLYGPATFGKDRGLRCPYFLDSGGCGIWLHRNSVCMSWFCKHVRGAYGARFWRALEIALLTAEQAIARYCVLELDVGEEALRELFAHPSTARDGHTDEGTGVDDVEHRRARWGLWHRRETEFFERAAQIAAPLRWEDVERLGGVELRARVALVRSARRALAETSLPAALEFAPLRIERTTGERVRVVTYSAFDPLEVPARLLALLPVFDGSPLAQVRCKLKDEHGIELDDSLIRRMIDFELLVEARLMNSPAAGTD